MKKILSFMLMLALFISLIPPARAAQGDLTLFALDPQDNSRWEKAAIDLAGDGDTLYILMGDKVYTWQPGGEMQVLIDGILTSRNYYEANTEERAGQPVFSSLFVEDGKITVLDTRVGSVFTVESIDGGKAVCSEPVMLEMDARIEEEDETYLNFQFERSMLAGNTLFVIGYDWESGSGDQELFVWDITTGERKETSLEGVQAMCEYKDGKLLCVICDPQNMYDSETQSYRPWTLAIYDPAADTLEEVTQVGEVRYYDARNIIYNEENDTFYLAVSNKIYRMVGLENFELAAYHPASSMWAEGKAVAAVGNQVAVFDEYGVYVRTPDPAQLPTATLSIYNYYDTPEHMQAVAALGDIPVFFSDNTYFNSAQEMGQALSSGENQLDILSVQMDWIDFNRLMEKGYCYDLSGSEALTGYVKELYPFIQDAVTQDGKLMALPYTVYGSDWHYNKKAFEELNLPVPTTYAELIALANEWAKEENSENWEEYTLLPDEGEYKPQVFYDFFEDYEQYMLSKGETLSLDTDTFRSVMGALETMDTENVEVMVDWGEVGDDEVPEELEELWNKEVLIANYYSIGLYNQGDMVPLPLRIDENSEHFIPMHLSVLFVNPKSKNIDAAVKYLEELAKAYRKNTQNLMELSPNYNEPVLNEYYEDNLENMENAVARMEKEIEEAEPIDKPALQENLDSYKEMVEDYKVTGRYRISEDMIKLYRDSMQYAVLARPSVMNNGDDDSFFTLRQRYLDEQITLEQFINEGSSKLRLIQLENQ